RPRRLDNRPGTGPHRMGSWPVAELVIRNARACTVHPVCYRRQTACFGAPGNPRGCCVAGGSVGQFADAGVGLTAESFDDGRTDVPGGVARPVERVLVVGAGIAGLTVANALTCAGVQCVVLEARDRAGGRLHTVDLAGSPVDLGGSWIHMPVGNPVRAFADQAGVRCRSANPLPELAGFDCGEGRRLSAAEVGERLSMQMEGFPQAK